MKTQYLFSLDSGLKEHLPTTIKSLVATNKVDVIHILHRDLDQEYLDNLESELKAFDVEMCRYQRSLPVDLENYCIEHKIPCNVYLYFWITQLGIKDRVIKLDVDIIITEDLSHLFTLDLLGAKIAAVHDNSIGQFRFSSAVKHLINHYVNAGVILFDLERCANDDLFQYMRDFGDIKSLLLHDQDLLNLYYQDQKYFLSGKYNISVNYIYIYSSQNANLLAGGGNFYVKSEDTYKKLLNNDLNENRDENQLRPIVLHFLGFNKPWKESNYPLANIWILFAKSSWQQIKLGSIKYWRDICSIIFSHSKMNMQIISSYDMFYYNWLWQFFISDLEEIKAGAAKLYDNVTSLTIPEFIEQYNFEMPSKYYQLEINNKFLTVDLSSKYNQILKSCKDHKELINLPPDIVHRVAKLMGVTSFNLGNFINIDLP